MEKKKHGMRWTTLRGLGKIVHASDVYFCCHELKENGKLDMENTMSSLNKIRILENDEQKKTNPNSNEAFELGIVTV